MTIMVQHRDNYKGFYERACFVVWIVTGIGAIICICLNHPRTSAWIGANAGTMLIHLVAVWLKHSDELQRRMGRDSQ
jgi:hypothetical protein